VLEQCPPAVWGTMKHPSAFHSEDVVSMEFGLTCRQPAKEPERHGSSDLLPLARTIGTQTDPDEENSAAAAGESKASVNNKLMNGPEATNLWTSIEKKRNA
jgi:hypothetical protein